MRIALLVALASVAGCASAPSTPGSSEAAAAPAAVQAIPEAAAAPAAVQAIPDATATAAAVASPAAAVADASKADGEFKAPAGYKARVENGATVYCRKVTVLGSRFPKDLCLTESQVRDLEATNDSIRRDKDQSSRVCTAGGCGST
jgi:hypothetical protein